jgi:cell division protein FtsQ
VARKSEADILDPAEFDLAASAHGESDFDPADSVDLATGRGSARASRRNSDRAAGRQDEDEPAPKPVRRTRSASGTARKAAKGMPIMSRVKWIAAFVALTLVLAAAWLVFHTVEQFLISDPRFLLADSDDDRASADSRALEIRGATHASSRQIAQTFAGDKGKSVYLVDLNERQSTLRNLAWVKDASVSRIWPNRLLVQIWERRPVAFLMASGAKITLVDEDGVILPMVPDRFHVPLLKGVRPGDREETRRAAVQLMLRVLRSVGDQSKAALDRIEQVDLSDLENVKLMEPYKGRMLTLLLGGEHYGARYRNFERHYQEISDQDPGGTTLDLRLEDRITVVHQ